MKILRHATVTAARILSGGGGGDDRRCWGLRWLDSMLQETKERLPDIFNLQLSRQRKVMLSVNVLKIESLLMSYLLYGMS